MEKFRINFDFIRLSKVKKGTDRKTKNTKKIDKRKKTKLTEKVDIGGHVLLFTETRKKKDVPGKLYKSSTQNKSFFDNNKIFLIKKRKKIGRIYYYLFKKDNCNELIKKKDFKDKRYTHYHEILRKKLQK